MSKRIVIIEDDEPSMVLYRLNLSGVPDIEIIAEFDNAEDALLQIPDLKPDVVIVDYSLPGMSGIEFAERLHKNLEIKILIATNHNPAHLVSKMIIPHNVEVIRKDWSEENLEYILKFCRNSQEKPGKM
jgi:DNA-binding NarL/FixJ family response regulator